LVGHAVRREASLHLGSWLRAWMMSQPCHRPTCLIVEYENVRWRIRDEVARSITLTCRGLRENETRWRFGLPGACEHWWPEWPVEACPLMRPHARWYPWWPGANAPIKGRIHWCKTAYRQFDKDSCNARPDHTFGSNCEILAASICLPLFAQQRTFVRCLILTNVLEVTHMGYQAAMWASGCLASSRISSGRHLRLTVLQSRCKISLLYPHPISSWGMLQTHQPPCDF